MEKEYQHISVMPEEVITGLMTDPEGIYVDCTLGGAGHASLMLERLGARGRLIGIDQDVQAVAHACQVLTDRRATVVQSNFSCLSKILCRLITDEAHLITDEAHLITDEARLITDEAHLITDEAHLITDEAHRMADEAYEVRHNVKSVQGVLFDLGVSSPQVDRAERGFSYMRDAALDMRMNQGTGESAADIVNTADVKELTHLFRTYGEERWAARIAQFIEERRKRKPIATTGELVDIITAAIPAAARRRGPHPAKRVFQALRIAVNRELEMLETALDQALACLKVNGRLAVITFHSLEEKILTEKIRDWLGKCVCPPGFPECRCGRRPRISLVTRKPVVPSVEEIERNPRARSAKLRIVEKILEDEDA